MLGADSLPLALFTNGYRITKLIDSYDPRLIEAKEQARDALQNGTDCARRPPDGTDCARRTPDGTDCTPGGAG
eukprot:3832356-Prymnesium_polylepis.2